jgi:hypothetical protein
VRRTGLLSTAIGRHRTMSMRNLSSSPVASPGAMDILLVWLVHMLEAKALPPRNVSSAQMILADLIVSERSAGWWERSSSGGKHGVTL